MEWLDGKARRIAAHLHGVEAGFNLKDIKAKMNQGERARRDEILAYGIARGWIVHRDGRYFGGTDPR